MHSLKQAFQIVCRKVNLSRVLQKMLKSDNKKTLKKSFSLENWGNFKYNRFLYYYYMTFYETMVVLLLKYHVIILIYFFS